MLVVGFQPCLSDREPDYHQQHNPERTKQEEVRGRQITVKLGAQQQSKRQLGHVHGDQVDGTLFRNVKLVDVLHETIVACAHDHDGDQTDDREDVEQPHGREDDKPFPVGRSIQPQHNEQQKKST